MIAYRWHFMAFIWAEWHCCEIYLWFNFFVQFLLVYLFFMFVRTFAKWKKKTFKNALRSFPGMLYKTIFFPFFGSRFRRTGERVYSFHCFFFFILKWQESKYTEFSPPTHTDTHPSFLALYNKTLTFQNLIMLVWGKCQLSHSVLQR